MRSPFDDLDGLRRWLKAMERRRRVLLFVNRSLALAAGVLLIFTLMILADRQWALSTSVRTAAAAAACCLAVAYFAAAFITALRPISILESAIAIERHRPALEERLLTLVSLPADIDQTIADKLQDEAKRSLEATPLFVASKGRRTIAAAAIAITLLSALSLAVLHKILTREMHRVLRPRASLPATFAPQLRLSASGTSVRQGEQPITLEANLARGGDPDRVVLHVLDPTGETTITMTSQGQNRYTRTLNFLLQSADVFATSGDLRSRTLHIHVTASLAPHPSSAPLPR